MTVAAAADEGAFPRRVKDEDDSSVRPGDTEIPVTLNVTLSLFCVPSFFALYLDSYYHDLLHKA